jgi:hypothetical protein
MLRCALPRLLFSVSWGRWGYSEFTLKVELPLNYLRRERKGDGYRLPLPTLLHTGSDIAKYI